MLREGQRFGDDPNRCSAAAKRTGYIRRSAFGIRSNACDFLIYDLLGRYLPARS